MRDTLVARPDGSGDDGIAGPDGAACHAAAVAAKRSGRPVDALHRHAEVVEAAAGRDVLVFKQVHEGRASIPGHFLGLIDDVVAAQRRHRNEVEIFHSQARDECLVIVANGREGCFLVIHQVHLVHGDDEVPYAEQPRDEGVAAGLRQHAVGGVDEDDGGIAGGGAGGHVAGVLLVAGGIGDDELALGRGKVAVGHVDGDALFALRLQPVDDEREIEFARAAAAGPALALDGRQLVLVNQLRIVQQASDERALAVVHGAARQKPQDLLVFVPGEIGVDVPFDQLPLIVFGRGFAGHQKYPSRFFCSIELTASRSINRP